MASASTSSRRPINGSPLPRMQLDDLSGLNDADQAGQNAQHAALGATRHHAGRRRLGIKAAIAGPLRVAKTLAWPSKRKIDP